MLFSSLDVAAVLLAAFLVAVLALRAVERCRDALPRGPSPVPLLGNFFMLRRGARIFASLDECRKAYGNLFTVYTGSVPSVVLCSYDLVREAFVKKGRWFEERTDSLVVPPNQRGGILWAPSPIWKEQRAFAVSMLKQATSDLLRLETIISREARTFVGFLGDSSVKSVDLALELHRRIARVTSAIVFGSDLPCDETLFNELVDHFHENTESLPLTVLSKTVPLLQYLPWDPFKLRQTRDNNVRIRMLLSDIVAVRKRALFHSTPPKQPDGFLDYYMLEMVRLGESPLTGQQQSLTGSFTDDNCINCLSQLLAAGTETTATVLRWAFLYVAIDPVIQQQLHNEIDSVIGRCGRPSWRENANSMPYVRAVLAEAMRIGCVVPLALPHQTTAEVSLADRRVPCRTEVLADLHAIFFDETLYAKPHTFDPTRFLDETGSYKKPESFIPFGVGKRMCIGETVARIEMFIFFVLVLRDYSLASPDGCAAAASARYNSTVGITRQPPRYTLVAVERV